MRALAASALILLLAACATAPQRPPPSDPEQAWHEHQQAVSGLVNWRVIGRIAIQTEDEGWQASIDWRQREDSYDIHLRGPLGSGSLRLVGDGSRVMLQSGDETVFASDPEALLFRQMGWRLPVAALRYWMLGLHAPAPLREQELDAYGRLARLVQAGWEIRFLNYAPHGEVELPGRVFVNNHRAKVRLVINRWQLDGLSPGA